jgi:hypothetical protein
MHTCKKYFLKREFDVTTIEQQGCGFGSGNFDGSDIKDTCMLSSRYI